MLKQRFSSERLTEIRKRGYFFQGIVVFGLLVCAGIFIYNYNANVARLALKTGFGFLFETAGVGIAQSLIPYDRTDPVWVVYFVGIFNTVLVSVFGVILATVLGALVGIGRLSSNWLLAKLSLAYVEVFRNIPVLVQMIIFYGVVLVSLPSIKNSLELPGNVVINNRGFYAPMPHLNENFSMFLISFLVVLAGCARLIWWSKTRRFITGEPFPAHKIAWPVLLVSTVLLYWITRPINWEFPELKGFNYQGGVRMLPEFLAVLLGLTFYTAAFIAEVVRSGIQAINKGQTEAAFSLGLSRWLVLRLVSFPQALRVIIPPLISQHLKLFQNSSLAAFIAYPELVSLFPGTMLNKEGHAIEILAMTMLAYLSISVSVSVFLNWYNQKIQFVEQ